MTALSPYPPIADYALIGDCHSAALVSRDGSIDWCCMPRFDSGSSFGRLIAWPDGGHFRVAPARAATAVFRRYLPGTLVLETVVRVAGGEAALLDLMVLQDPEYADGPQLVRVIEGRR